MLAELRTNRGNLRTESSPNRVVRTAYKHIGNSITKARRERDMAGIGACSSMTTYMLGHDIVGNNIRT